MLSTKPVATPATKDKVAILAHVESDTIAQHRPRVGCADAVGAVDEDEKLAESAHHKSRRRRKNDDARGRAPSRRFASPPRYAPTLSE